MNDVFSHFSKNLSWVDALDVLIVSLVVYRVLLLIKGTRAMQMLTGLGILAIGYYLSGTFQLFTTHLLLSWFFDYFVFIVIVLFQDDLRRALTQVGKNPFFSAQSSAQERAMIEDICKSASYLAKRKIGALIVLERETGLKDFIETGSALDADVKAELMTSIFAPTSPIHDGAIIISSGRIAAAGCFLPLSKEIGIDKRLGTRHRAALGLTEETDAVVVLVSEETGEVHLVRGGQLMNNLSEEELMNGLKVLLEVEKTNPELPRRLKTFLLKVQGK